MKTLITGGQAITYNRFGQDKALKLIGHLNNSLSSGNYGLAEIGYVLYLHYISGHLKPKEL